MEQLPLVAAAARTFGIMVGLPFGDSLQMTSRLFVATLWGAALVPQYEWFVSVSPVKCGCEFLIGLLLAMPLRLLIESAAMFGELLDTGRGQTLSSIVDPLNGQQVSDLTTVMRVGVAALAVYLGALEHLVALARDSYVMLPFGGTSLDLAHLMSVMRVGISIIETSVLLSSAWLIGYLLCDLVCALLSKVLQGVSFSTTGALAKLVITGALLLNLLRDTSGWGELVQRATFTPSLWGPSSQKMGGGGVR